MSERPAGSGRPSFKIGLEAPGAPAFAQADSAAPEAGALLSKIGAGAGRPPEQVEFSIRVSAGRVEWGGRWTLWYRGADADPAIDRLLLELGAAPMLVAARPLLGSERFGLGVCEAGGPEIRLYLHGLDDKLMDSYRAIRWRAGESARRAAYRCHFMPESPLGERPAALVHPLLRSAAAALVDEGRQPVLHAFWLRQAIGGDVDQVDLTFPACPVATTLRGFEAALGALGVPDADRPALRRLPLRHIGFSTEGSEPGMTLYISGSANGSVPASEAALQATAVSGAREENRKLAALLGALPAACPGDDAKIDGFYGGSVAPWKKVLGDELHYHHGIYRSDQDSFETAARRAVTELYPFLNRGERLYDIGCGWGGPLAMIVRDLRCPVVGITPSRAQYRYVAGLGYRACWADAAAFVPPGRFDCALLLESLEHIAAKEVFLRRLRPFVRRIVMRMNCQDGAPPGTAFGTTMHMISSTALRALLERSGWTVRHWRDRRAETLRSQHCWSERLATLSPSELRADPHLRLLGRWCARVVTDRQRWAESNPLIEVVAD